jgi:hypothetical protein
VLNRPWVRIPLSPERESRALCSCGSRAKPFAGLHILYTLRRKALGEASGVGCARAQTLRHGSAQVAIDGVRFLDLRRVEHVDVDAARDTD